MTHVDYYIKHITFGAQSDALKSLEYMRQILDTYGFVTVADLCDLAGINSDYIDNKYGWTNLDKATVIKIGGHYELSLPGRIRLDEEEKTEDAMVSHPSHYQSETGLEVIDVIEAFTSDLTGIEATDTGNVLKYMCRWKKKNGLQDLEKAKWYLQHLIDHMNEKGEN